MFFQLIGIDNESGEIKYAVYLPDFERFNKDQGMKIVVQRTSKHFPHLARCAIIAKHKVSYIFFIPSLLFTYYYEKWKERFNNNVYLYSNLPMQKILFFEFSEHWKRTSVSIQSN